MPGRSWKRHLARVGFAGALLLAIGAYFDQLYPVAIAGLAAYAVWQLANMARLHRWLDGGEPEPPESVYPARKRPVRPRLA